MKNLKQAIVNAINRVIIIQRKEGYWVFDLEADTTITSEYIILQRFLGKKIEPDLKNRLSRYICSKQLPDGGWPIYEKSTANVSASVKAYFALKLIGDSPELSHMAKARKLILSLGGAANVNVFTRITLALFGQIPWRTAPAMPVEIMFLPKWSFFHINKVSYWSRTVIVPLLILYAKRPICLLRPEERVTELFLEPPDNLFHLDRCIPGHFCKNFFILLDRILKRIEGLIPRTVRKKGIGLAQKWTLDHMEGKGGLGAIFPAMANAVMALKVLGYPDNHPDMVRGIKAIDDLLVTHGNKTFCQPCVSPVWDTCLILSALREAGIPSDHQSVTSAIDWLFTKQIFVAGDWSTKAPNLESGCWAFQFENRFYPDVDDTAMVLMAMLRAGILNGDRYKEKIKKAVNWIIGMQSSDGGWGAFDIDNNNLYLNNIPFADHGALLDPSTSDLTARCVELLSMLGYGRDFPPIARALHFLRKNQEEIGAWYGRWGVNYIYGTWSVIMGLRQVGEDMSLPYVRKAIEWLKSCQNKDGGWGETCDSYNAPYLAGNGDSTASQTAWALLGLMAAGEVKSSAVQKGVTYLLSTQNVQGGWDERLFTGTGFPRVFYLRYHGYSLYFPLWALGIYQRLRQGQIMCQDEIRLEKSMYRQAMGPEVCGR